MPPSSVILGVSLISMRSTKPSELRLPSRASQLAAFKNTCKARAKNSRLFNLKHIKTNTNAELMIKGDKDKSSGCKDLSQPKNSELSFSCWQQPCLPSAEECGFTCAANNCSRSPLACLGDVRSYVQLKVVSSSWAELGCSEEVPCNDRRTEKEALHAEPLTNTAFKQHTDTLGRMMWLQAEKPPLYFASQNE